MLSRHRNFTMYRSNVTELPTSVARPIEMILEKQRAVDVFQVVLRLAVDLFQIPEDLAFVRIADPSSGQTKNYTTLQKPFAPNYLNTLDGITGRTMKQRKPQLVSDVKRDEDFVPYASGAKQGKQFKATRSELAVPLMFGNDCFGVMNFESPERGWFEENDIQWALLLGTIVAFAEHQERISSEQEGNFSLINTSTRQQVGALLDQTLHQLALSADCMAEVMLYADQAQELFTFEIRPSTSTAFHRSLRLGEGFTGRYFISQQSFVGTINQQPGENIAHLLSSRSVLIIPLSHAGRSIGVLNIESPHPGMLTQAKLDQLVADGLPSQLEDILATVNITSISSDQVKDRLIDELRQRILETVGAENPQEIYTQILQVASRVVGAPDVSGGLILIRDEKQNLPSGSESLADLYAVRAARIGAFASDREWPMNERSIAKRVVTSLTPARVGDVRLDPDWKDSGTGASESSELIVPLQNSTGAGIGVIGLVSPGLDRFSAADQTYLESVAKIAGLAIQRIEEIRQARRHAQQLALQGELLRLIEQELFLTGAQVTFNIDKVEAIRERVFTTIIQWAAKYTASEHAAVLLARSTEGRGQYLSVVARSPSELVTEAPSWWPRDEGITGEAFTTGQTINSRDNTATHNSTYLPYFLGAQSEVATPIKVGNITLGVLDVESDTAFHFTNHYVQWAEFLAQQLAFVLTVIENASRRRFEIALTALSHQVDQGIKEMPALKEWTQVRFHRNRLMTRVITEMLALTGSHVGRVIVGANAYDENDQLDLVNGQLVYLASTDIRELEPGNRFFPITDGVTSRAFTQQRDIIYNDKESRPQGYFDSDITRDCRSGIFVPVLEGTLGVGILDIESLDENRFPPDAVQAIHEASELVSKLLAAGRQRLNELLNDLLLRFQRNILISLSGDLNSFMKQVLEYAAPISDILDGWGAVLTLRQWESQGNPVVDTTYSVHYPETNVTFQAAELDHTFPAHPALAKVMETKMPALILGTLGVVQHGLPWRNAAVQSLICVPLLKPIGDQDGIGVEVSGLLVLASPRPGDFSEADKRALSEYAKAIIGGLKNVAALDFSKNLLGDLRHDADAALVPLLISIEELDDLIQSVSASDVSAAVRATVLDLKQQVKHVYSLSRLVNDTLNALFDFSNNDLLPEAPTKDSTIADIVLPMRESMDELAAKKQRTIYWEITTDLPVFGGDHREKMIRAVLFKFLDNAIKYADPNTAISVRGREVDSTAHLEVVSRGKLVPSEERDAIWYLEYRGSNVAGGAGGSGLGLYQARVIAGRLGGRAIYAPQAPNENIFALELPLAQRRSVG